MEMGDNEVRGEDETQNEGNGGAQVAEQESIVDGKKAGEDDMETDDNAKALGEGASDGDVRLYGEEFEGQLEVTNDNSFGQPEEDMAQAELELAARAEAAAQLTARIREAQVNSNNPDQLQHGHNNQAQLRNDDSAVAQLQDEGSTAEQRVVQTQSAEENSQDNGGERE
jgi:hypothetical protein